MVIVTDLSDLLLIADASVRKLVFLRLQQMLPAPTIPAPFEFIVVEGGEAISELESALGIPILTSLFDDLPFGHPDYIPPFEIMEEHQYEQYRIYEMVFIGNDDGAATALFIPDQEGIDANILAVCRSFCTRAPN